MHFNSPDKLRSAWSLLRGSLLAALALAAAAPLAASCAATPPEEEELAHDHETDAAEPEERSDAFSGGTVGDAAASSCATSSVRGLSLQIIEEGNCVQPGAFEPMPELPNLVMGSNINAFLEKPARDRLVAALQANPGMTLSINSMLRSVAQQYLLYSWYLTGSCGISLAARPGNSNHETGLALDVNEYDSWMSELQNQGFQWYGSSDPVHFDYVGSGAVSHKGLDVLAFQRLWNRNHPEDKIPEDGAWGPNTEARMARSPASGFPKGAQCDDPAEENTCDAVFADICSSPHEEDIAWLAGQGLTGGCDAENKLYCPDAEVTRGQMATFLAAALELPAGPDKFSDDAGSAHEDAINAIAAAGITSGCDSAGTKFCPNDVVSRGQMAVFLVKAFDLPAGSDAFADDNGSMYEDAINAIAAAGISAGCDAVNHLYCPNGKVTRGQVATFLRRALE